jgi:hypothetical protein
MLPNQIVILGGGASVRYLGAIDRGLFSFLKDKFVIGVNYSYKFVETTCNLGVDENLYNNETTHAEITKLPLWIGKDHRDLKHKEDNSIFLRASKTYSRDLSTGCYRSSLSGIFALSLAIKLADLGQKDSEIYLLGYDYGPAKKDGQTLLDSQGKPITHWYQEDFRHRGTGKVSWYLQTGLDMETRKRLAYAELEFRPFAAESKVKIFNVCPTSMIPTFPKIDYEAFFSLKSTPVHNQDALRRELREVLSWIKQDKNI